MHPAMSSENGVHTLPEHLQAFALMHVGMRRDARRLVDAAPNVTPGTASALNSWWRQLHDVIDWHHRSEDDVLWPSLRALVPEFGAIEREMLHDHSALEESMAQVSANMRRSTGMAALAPAAHRFHQILVDHLRHEEAAIFPVLAGNLTIAQYTSIEQRIIGSAPPRVMSYLQPWMFDEADPSVTRQVGAGIPTPLRLLGNTLLRIRYQRTVDPVLALR
ncbi:hemerythrin domain-containing protein [Actinoplanes derwentensis]|uniref:Hemerythrin HHE cation binding domain-containing protein n=1 Tax=Actinoplanes derwentensis TaxID=113562 RepID=A0A1H1RAZ6_9ACTN|nr:hemerythrin domain-containing protein [Actinoplanes derwentensis]GID88061.1 hypothetical protein Ade03nite_69850 [Actinoplanes derwentensis]SDS32901.1 Hemerythrin HHE cation binding domain-containing protein [Actinoplanes derwentensis]